MAATFRTSAAGGSTSGTSNRTVAITPAVGDLLIVYCFVSTNTNDSPTCTDNNGSGTYTRIDVGNVVIATLNHRLSIFVRDALMTNTTATTITVATGSNTSGAVHCLAIAGMGRTGLTGAVRSKGLQNNQAAGTAAPALNQAALTANLTIVAQGSADTTTTAPASWTERQDTNFATPTIALETATRDSGFTGTTITFGAASSTTFCSHALELDGSIPISPITGTADLAFGGTNTLTGTGALAGVAALAIGAVGTLVAAISGSATLTLGASAHLYEPQTQLHPHAVIGMRYGDFYKPPGRVAGTAVLALGATGTVEVNVLIAGTATLTFDGRAVVPRWTTQLQPHMWPGRRYGDFDRPAGPIDGTAPLTFGGAGVLNGMADIHGESDLTLGGSGTLAGTGGLVGVATVTFGATGMLDLPIGEIVGTAALTFGGAAVLSGAGALRGSADLLFTGTGSPVVTGVMTGVATLTISAELGVILEPATTPVFWARRPEVCRGTRRPEVGRGVRRMVP